MQVKPDFAVTKSMIRELLEMSERYYKITNQILKTIEEGGVLDYSEYLSTEIAKFNINSYISKQYFEDLLSGYSEKQDEDVINLYKLDSEQVTKCVSALVESRKIMNLCSISLEIH